MIHLDCETRSAVDIFKVGAYVYANHPSTQILCLAYAIDDGQVELLPRDFFAETWPTCPSDLYEAAVNGDMFCAHNSFFEQCVWEAKLFAMYGWPRLKLEQWKCSQAKASACALPKSLEKVAAALHLPVQKDMDGHRVMKKVSRPKEVQHDGRIIWNEKPEDLQKLYQYCINDVETERGVDKALPDLTTHERNVWILDQKINHRGVSLDIEAVHAAQWIIDKVNDNLSKELSHISGGMVSAATQRDGLLAWVQHRGVAMPDLTKATVADILARHIPDDVRRALEIRKQAAKTSTAKYLTMDMASDGEGRLRDILKYHAATTGRWGGKLVQLQNLPRGQFGDMNTLVEAVRLRDLKYLTMMYSDPMEALSSAIRGMIVAAPGHDLIAADYSAIEARMVMWLAGEEVGLQKFRDKIDIYKDMARTILHKQLHEILKIDRQLGKQAILGCGFGMGGPRFKETCATYNIDITPELAQIAVDSYRRTYHKVQCMWWNQEQAAVRAVGTGQVVDCGKVRWAVRGKFLVCKLPSGRPIVYYDPQLRDVVTPWNETKKAVTFMGLTSNNQWVRQSTYGGKLVENITQACARDLMAIAMLNLEAMGYRNVLTVHDEIVVEVPEGEGTLEEMIEIMTYPHPTFDGLPVAAEGWRGKRYHK